MKTWKSRCVAPRYLLLTCCNIFIYIIRPMFPPFISFLNQQDGKCLKNWSILTKMFLEIFRWWKKRKLKKCPDPVWYIYFLKSDKYPIFKTWRKKIRTSSIIHIEITCLFICGINSSLTVNKPWANGERKNIWENGMFQWL